MWPETCQWRPELPSELPETLSAGAERCLQQLQAALPEQAEQIADLASVWACSPWAARQCSARPELLAALITDGWDVQRDYPRMLAELALELDELVFMRQLRLLRQREMLRITIRDLMGWAPLEQTLSDLSDFAAACVARALAWCQAQLAERYGVPRNVGGEEQSLIIYGMGKLGGGELNFSSDIDLIFFYPQEGVTDGAKELDNHRYFIRLGQQLIKVLDETTTEGFVFRVDMRLRPFGDAGALAVSFAAAENYYQTQGREWERYALIKAKPLTGFKAQVEQLHKTLRPFVFRRYLDFTAIQSLRELKQMIEEQVARKGMEGNIKLGRGGIREVEFIGQAFQLIYGGRNPQLQVRGIVPVLQTLAAEGLLEQVTVDGLLRAYTFLRLAENRLQMVEDAQTHELPREEPGQLRLAYAMGFTNWDAFLAELNLHRERVAEQFALVFASPEEAQAEVAWDTVWRGELESRAALAKLGLQAGDDEAIQRLAQLRESSAYQKAATESRQRIDRFMPLLLAEVAALSGNRLEALLRLLNFVRAVARRSVYLVLLEENPKALKRLVRFFAESEWVSEQLTRQPAVLDQLLDGRLLYSLDRRPRLDEVLAEKLAQVDEADFEAQLDALRQFKNSYTLNVAAVDLNDEMPLMRVSDHLTECAEVLLQQAHRIAWREVTARHGFPHCWRDGQACNPGMAVIGYGKLGGIELGYSSDLDLVFIHDSGGEREYTDGRPPEGKGSIDNTLFFARLAQKLVHVMNTQTLAGQLYEIDTRLRPDGEAGALVKSLHGFAAYMQDKAWTWEHQALVRARVICGSEALAQGFEQVRREILCQSREMETLRGEVIEMREKMRGHLGGRDGMFSLKQDRGGLTDIEFMVQFAVLAHAGKHPELTRYSDNIRILETMADCGVMTAQDAQTLIESYRAIRAKIHRLALDRRKSVVESPGELQPVVDAVAHIWSHWMLAK